MWDQIRRSLARRFPAANFLADVVYEAPAMSGQYKKSLFQWRVKRRADGTILVSLKMIADYSGGSDGAIRNYIDFDPTDADQIKAGLDACLTECSRLKAEPK